MEKVEKKDTYEIKEHNQILCTVTKSVHQCFVTHERSVLTQPFLICFTYYF